MAVALYQFSLVASTPGIPATNDWNAKEITEVGGGAWLGRGQRPQEGSCSLQERSPVPKVGTALLGAPSTMAELQSPVTDATIATLVVTPLVGAELAALDELHVQGVACSSCHRWLSWQEPRSREAISGCCGDLEPELSQALLYILV